MDKALSKQAIFVENPKYSKATERTQPLYLREGEIRDDFQRDYTRILFSKSYRRLKHKTQVFFAIENDHICTRQEHVQLVSSVATTIGEYLGLNLHLIQAIALGHDLGHAPFGHGGEKILDELSMEHQLGHFYHEQNGYYLVSQVETLLDDSHQPSLLNLTYATLDGILCHCGELNQRQIKPRLEPLPLKTIQTPGQCEPWTYCGCVVKMSDKIAYLSRDIEDALNLQLIDATLLKQLMMRLEILDPRIKGVDNGHLIHYFINDVCLQSNAIDGICLSENAYQVMVEVMRFNYQYIYLNQRLKRFDDYVGLMIHQLFDVLLETYKQSLDDYESMYPTFIRYFKNWLETHPKLYDISVKSSYTKAILDYISSMTDHFIVKVYQELVSF